MKICIGVRALPIHNNGGMEKHTYLAAKGLAEKGHDVYLITTAHPDGIDSEIKDNIKLFYLQNTISGKYSILFWSMLNKKINELDRQFNFDIIHFQGFAGFTFGFGNNKSFITTVHGTMFSETLLYYPLLKKYNFSKYISLLFRYKTRFVLYPFYKFILHKAKRIVVDSNFTKRELEESNPQLSAKISVVQLGTEFSDFPVSSKKEAREKLGFNANDFILFTVGRIDDTKGIDTALEAIKLLNDKGILVKYIVGGRGPKQTEYERYCKDNNLSNVIFKGFIKEEELNDYYSAADIFLFPDITAPAFGLVAIESMHCGTPVLGSKRGAIPEVVSEEVGWTFEACNSIDLADKINYLYNNKNEIIEKSKICKDYVENNFSKENMINNLISVYEKFKKN